MVCGTVRAVTFCISVLMIHVHEPGDEGSGFVECAQVQPAPIRAGTTPFGDGEIRIRGKCIVVEQDAFDGAQLLELDINRSFRYAHLPRSAV
jgi:hypothetical protein